MQPNKILSKIKLSLLLVILGTFLCPFFTKTEADKNIGLQLSPVLIERDLASGDSSSASVRLVNLNESSVTYSVDVQAVTKDEFNNQIIFDTNPYSKEAESWINFEENTIELGGNQQKTINFSVNVPTDAVSGSYSLLLNFPAADETQRIITSSNEIIDPNVAVVLLLTIDGTDLIDSAEITKFVPSKKVFFTKDITVNTIISNLGQTYIKPVGVFEVFEGSNQISVYQENFNENYSTILKNSKKSFTTKFTPNKYKFGKYKAVLTVAYGRRNSVMLKETTFWILPWDLILKILAIFFLSLILVSAIFWKRRKRKLIM